MDMNEWSLDTSGGGYNRPIQIV